MGRGPAFSARAMACGKDGTTLLGNKSWRLHVRQCNLDGKGMTNNLLSEPAEGVLADHVQVREIE